MSGTLKIAVTGGAGSGKTSVCSRLKTLGLRCISSDTLAKDVVARGTPAYEKVVQYFGNAVLLNDGRLNRRKIRQIITKNDAARTVLEQCLHPEINKLIQLKVTQARQDGERFVLIEIPLLFELGIQDQFDIVIMVSADRDLRIQRLAKRDGVSKDEAKNLINVQLPDDKKKKQSDVVITNNGSVEQLIHSVDQFYKKLVNLQ